jgi:MoaA/NifB/PqqE/SkfB family radical SAM enzyme
VTERLVVVFRVTTRCALACGFCAFDRRLPFARVEADVAVADALAAALEPERARRPVHVSFLGGEPFAWPPLTDVSRRYWQRGLSLGVTTNGTTLASDATRQLLLDCFDELTVSIDGIGDVHDRLRGWPGGFDRLEASVRWLVAAKARRPRPLLVRVNSVLMADNVRKLPELCRTLASWGVEELTFNRLGGRDRPEFHEQHRLAPADLAWLADILPSLRRESAQLGLRLLGSDGYLQRLQELEEGRTVAVDDCAPGRDFVFVDETGRVAPCHFTLADYGTALLPIARLAPRFRESQQQPTRSAACDDCQSTRVFRKFGAEHGA